MPRAAQVIYGVPNEAAGYGYVNVPKAACTSIQTAISSHRNVAIAASPRTCGVLRIVKLQHLHWFTVVRHPCDRLVSLWADYLTPPYPRESLAANPELSHFVGWSFGSFARAIARHDPRRTNAHYAPQTDLLHYNSQPLAAQVLRFESLSDDWAELSDRFGIPALPHLRKSDHLPWQEMYTPELAQMVRHRYADDFRNYGYEVDLC
jgi:hypothetical protein